MFYCYIFILLGGMINFCTASERPEEYGRKSVLIPAAEKSTLSELDDNRRIFNHQATVLTHKVMDIVSNCDTVHIGIKPTVTEDFEKGIKKGIDILTRMFDAQTFNAPSKKELEAYDKDQSIYPPFIGIIAQKSDIIHNALCLISLTFAEIQHPLEYHFMRQTFSQAALNIFEILMRADQEFNKTFGKKYFYTMPNIQNSEPPRAESSKLQQMKKRRQQRGKNKPQNVSKNVPAQTHLPDEFDCQLKKLKSDLASYKLDSEKEIEKYLKNTSEAIDRNTELEAKVKKLKEKNQQQNKNMALLQQDHETLKAARKKDVSLIHFLRQEKVKIAQELENLQKEHQVLFKQSSEMIDLREQLEKSQNTIKNLEKQNKRFAQESEDLTEQKNLLELNFQKSEDARNFLEEKLRVFEVERQNFFTEAQREKQRAALTEQNTQQLYQIQSTLAGVHQILEQKLTPYSPLMTPPQTLLWNQSQNWQIPNNFFNNSVISQNKEGKPIITFPHPFSLNGEDFYSGIALRSKDFQQSENFQ